MSSPVSKQEFLESKATNFKAYLERYNPSDKVRDYITHFSSDQLIPTIATKIIPLKAVNGIEASAAQLLQELQVDEGDKDAVKNKIIAYMNMFASVVME